jgi:hypothetical protein
MNKKFRKKNNIFIFYKNNIKKDGGGKFDISNILYISSGYKC